MPHLKAELFDPYVDYTHRGVKLVQRLQFMYTRHFEFVYSVQWRKAQG